MIKRILSILFLVGLIATAGCHMENQASVRADYYGAYYDGPGYAAPYYRGYYNRFYDPYYYPAYYPGYYYDPYYPSFFFGTSFFYGYPYYPYVVVHPHRVYPGAHSLHGFRGGTHGWTTAPSQGGGGSSGGSSGGGRSLR